MSTEKPNRKQDKNNFFGLFKNDSGPYHMFTKKKEEKEMEVKKDDIVLKDPTGFFKKMTASVELSKIHDDFAISTDEETTEPIKIFNHVKHGISQGYDMKVTIHKTVLIIGDARVGKSQFVKNIVYPGYISMRKAWSETPSPTNFTISVELEGATMTVDFIDTPGFNEQSEKGVPRNNERIKEIITRNLKKMTTKIDMIVVVVKELNDKSMDAIDYCIRLFGPSCASIIYLMFTYSENLGSLYEDKMIKQVKNVSRLSNVREVIGDKFLFTGCISEQLAESVDLCKSATQLQSERNLKFLQILHKTSPIFLDSILSSDVSVAPSVGLVKEQVLSLRQHLMASIEILKATGGEVLEMIKRSCQMKNDELVTEDIKDYLPAEDIRRLEKIVKAADEAMKTKMELDIDTSKFVKEIEMEKHELKELSELGESMLGQIQNVKEDISRLDKVKVVVIGFNERIANLRKPISIKRNDGFNESRIKEDL